MSEMRYSAFSAMETLKARLWQEYDHRKPTIIVCVWDGDGAPACVKIFIALEEAIAVRKLDIRVDLHEVDSYGLEDQFPLVMMLPTFVLHSHVALDQIDSILDEFLSDLQYQGKIIEKAMPIPLPTAEKPQEKPTLGNTLLGAMVMASRQTSRWLRRESQSNSAQKKSTIQLDLEKTRDHVLAKYDPNSAQIVICAWEGACAKDAITLYQAMRDAVEKAGSGAMVHIKKIDPRSFRDLGPLVLILPLRAVYVRVRRYDAENIVQRTILNHELLEGLCYQERPREEPRTLTLDELSALATEAPYLSQFTSSTKQKTNFSLEKEALPLSIRLLVPGTAQLLPPEKIHMGATHRMIEKRLILFTEKAQQRTKRSENLHIEPKKNILTEEGNQEEAALMTVSQLMSIAENKPAINRPDNALRQLVMKCETLRGNSKAEISLLYADQASWEEAKQLADALRAGIQKLQISVHVRIVKTATFGYESTMAVVYPARVFYHGLKASDAEQLLHQTILQGEVLTKWLVRDTAQNEIAFFLDELPETRNQTRMMTDQMEKTDPASLTDTLLTGGYAELANRLSQPRTNLLDDIVSLELLEMSAAAADVGARCQFFAQQIMPHKTVLALCSSTCDEVDIDGFTASTFPHRVIEGMILVAFATGAECGKIVLSGESGHAAPILEKAIADARANGLLGRDILHSNWNFDLEIISISEATAGGEETAILHWLRDGLAEPEALDMDETKGNLTFNMKTYPLITQLFQLSRIGENEIGQSPENTILTAIKNAETAQIWEHPVGMKAQTFLSLFTSKSASTNQKGIQFGSRIGPIYSAEWLDFPLDCQHHKFVSRRYGSTLYPLDEAQNVVLLAKEATKFHQKEACGRCLTCRVGVKRMESLLEKILSGQANAQDLKTLKEVTFAIRDSAFCHFGKDASATVLSSLNYFSSAYEALLIQPWEEKRG